MTPATVC